MNSLANAIIEAAAFIELSSDEIIDPDSAVSILETIISEFQSLNDEERGAISRSLREKLSTCKNEERRKFLEEFLVNFDIAEA